MAKITHNKLVRDKIPAIIEASGKIANIRTLDTNEYIRALDTKLQEELNEYLEEGSMEEMADLLEVAYAAIAARGYTLEAVEDIRRQKAEKRGSFEKRIFLTDVTDQ